ncbi:hypothetical protein ACCT24_12080 [Rhizobium ruizarguesonis]|jgi:hypothetical protein|uniref:hypothetical protein n=1 Tax=Rhizobium ruizarguesonis TaxID=2081791 RepID=UPI00102F4930|nr:hypothetical protein [Rhizobium ruizarguesonis]TAT76919.1 hypothetical protein ELI56_01180 [Rhizobium ruizarguesonis]
MFEEIPDDFAAWAYQLDRSNEADGYCDFVDQIVELVRKLQTAILAKKRKKAKVLRRELKHNIQSWPISLFLDVTEEHVEPLVKQLLLLLRMMRKGASAEIRLAAVTQALLTLQEERLAAEYYQEGSDD